MDESIKKLLYRIKNSGDGKDFIDFLLKLSTENYKAMKQEGGEVLRGKAIAFDFLIDALLNSENSLVENAPTEWL